MGIRYFLIALSLQAVSCASLEKSDECRELTSQFALEGLDINKFRRPFDQDYSY